jgi:hypothetical protein
LLCIHCCTPSCCMLLCPFLSLATSFIIVVTPSTGTRVGHPRTLSGGLNIWQQAETLLNSRLEPVPWQRRSLRSSPKLST